MNEEMNAKIRQNFHQFILFLFFRIFSGSKASMMYSSVYIYLKKKFQLEDVLKETIRKVKNYSSLVFYLLGMKLKILKNSCSYMAPRLYLKHAVFSPK